MMESEARWGLVPGSRAGLPGSDDMNETDRLQRQSQAHGLRIIGHTDLGGHGDTMHVEVRDGVAYVGHMGRDRVGTSIVDVSDPRRPRLVRQLLTPEGTHTHKVQIVGDIMLVNAEQNFYEPGAPHWQAGVLVYDISDRLAPQQVGFLPTPGKGVHRMTFTEMPYAYVTGSDHGYTDQFLIVADLSDPSRPTEVGRWWARGMNAGAGEVPTWPGHRRSALHHVIARNDRAYAAWWDQGLYILDIADKAQIREIGHLALPEQESGCTHTALPLPGRDLVVLADEAMSATGPHGMMNAISPESRRAPKHIRMIDISHETAPEVIAVFPVPPRPAGLGAGRFGPHNLHEMGPDTFQSSTIVHATYFGGGLRVYDVADATAPLEIASLVPPPAPGADAIQLNDLTVTPDGTIFATDRDGGGLYIVEPEFDLI